MSQLDQVSFINPRAVSNRGGGKHWPVGLAKTYLIPTRRPALCRSVKNPAAPGHV
jgi:hypothetical protein